MAKGRGRRFRRRNRGRSSRGDNVRSSTRSSASMVRFGDFGPAVSKSFLPCLGFPDRLVVKLKYTDQYSFSGAAPAAQVWRVNSLFDPDLTGTGHQPRYFDQLSAVYGQYCVKRFAVKLTCINTGAKGMFVTALYCDSNIGTFSQPQLAEQRYSVTKVLDVPTGVSRAVLSLPWVSVMQIQGQEELESDPNNYQGVGQNPTDVVYCIFKALSDDAVTASTLEIQADVEFEAVFKELSPPAPSLKKARESSSESTVKVTKRVMFV